MTFGSTSTSASSSGAGRYYYYGGRFNCTSVGTADSISAYINYGWPSNPMPIQFGLYDISGNIIANGKTPWTNVSVDGANHLVTIAFTGTKPTLAVQEYLIIGLMGSTDGGQHFHYDAGTGTEVSVYKGSGPALGDSFTPSFTSGRVVEIYCSYTVSSWTNRAPTITVSGPGNGTTGVNLYNRTSAYIGDLDGNSTTVCFWNNKTGVWVKAQQNNSVTANTTVRDMHTDWCNQYSTKYWWKVTANDTHANTSAIFYFTTKANTKPVISNNFPVNISFSGTTLSGVYVSRNPTLSCRINDSNAEYMNLTFRSNASGSWQSIGWHNHTLNATVSNTTSVFTTMNHTYWYSINVTDNHSGWTNHTYHFYLLQGWSGLVIANNSVNCTGSIEYQYRPLLGMSGEEWVWVNLTGILTPLHHFENIIDAVGTHFHKQNSTGYWIWANYTGTGGGGGSNMSSNANTRRNTYFVLGACMGTLVGGLVLNIWRKKKNK